MGESIYGCKGSGSKPLKRLEKWSKTEKFELALKCEIFTQTLLVSKNCKQELINFLPYFFNQVTWQSCLCSAKMNRYSNNNNSSHFFRVSSPCIQEYLSCEVYTKSCCIPNTWPTELSMTQYFESTQARSKCKVSVIYGTHTLIIPRMFEIFNNFKVFAVVVLLWFCFY